MAITNYTELLAAISDWLNRDDLTSVLGDFVTLAEEDINSKLRHYDMERRSTATISTRYVSPPVGWLGTVSFRLGSPSQGSLELISRDEMATLRGRNEDATGMPQYYCLTAGEFEVYPTPDQTYTGELVYFAAITPLSEVSPTNWLLDRYPSLYLYGALIHSAPYLDDDPRATTWASLYQARIEAANAESNAARWSGSGLSKKIRNF